MASMFRTGFALAAVALALPAGPADAQEKAPEPGSTDETFFTLRPDFRACAAPFCGGYFVQRVNRRWTRCSDGEYRRECYVAELELGALALSERRERELRAGAHAFLLQAELGIRAFPGAGALGQLRVSGAWRGHPESEPRGLFYRARDRGIVCITGPCPSLTAQVLGWRLRPLTTAGVDLSGVGTDPAPALVQLRRAEGLMLAARLRRVTGPGGRSAVLMASEFYLPFPAPRPCGLAALEPCDVGEFCAFAPEAQCGGAGLPGRCTPIPETCAPGPGAGPPVCGCDGQPYASACAAAASGTSPDASGRCDLRGCGGISGMPCEAGEFCDPGPGQCATADGLGVCRDVPEACLTLYSPVCGCDGRSYGNLCEAQLIGIGTDHLGECTAPE